MRPIGFSTGALAKGDFRRALGLLRVHGVDIVELSALRLEELEPLIAAIPELDLTCFGFVAVHAPSRFHRESEAWVTDALMRSPVSEYPIVVHPDVIFTPELWSAFGDRLLIENMDKRKPVGRSVSELSPFFEMLPAARFCFDIGHARQVDPSMTEAVLLLRAFAGRLGEVHISEVNTASRHDPISPNAAKAFQAVARYIPEKIPIILEPLIDQGQSRIETEIKRARNALSRASSAAA
jgi:hypothetical protein